MTKYEKKRKKIGASTFEKLERNAFKLISDQVSVVSFPLIIAPIVGMTPQC